MKAAFYITAILTLASATAALSLRNLIHCVLCLVAAFAGLAAIYLQLSAEFIGLAQILVYVGAVAILIAFAILVTRGAASEGTAVIRSWVVGVGVAAFVFAVIGYAIFASPRLASVRVARSDITVGELGRLLMTDYVLPLETMALLLTAALIGAVILALPDSPAKQTTASGLEGPKQNAGFSATQTSSLSEPAQRL